MNNLLKFVLKNNPIPEDNLIAVLNAIKEEDRGVDLVHIVSVLIGIEPVMPYIPSKAFIDGKEATFVSYDLLRNRVGYTYHDLAKKWFKSQEAADVYSSGDNNYGYDYSYGEKPEYPFCGSREQDYTSSVDIQTWLNNALTD